MIVNTSIINAPIEKNKIKVDDLLFLLNDDKINAKTVKAIPMPIMLKNKSKNTSIN
ncbi:MAG: hypothetical protein ACI8ZM_003013 [Crocinitomix sp.]|jgi:hypothetical protein